MEKYYFITILNAMAKALDIPSECNAITAKSKLLECRENLPKEDKANKYYIEKYVELIDALYRALEKNNDKDYNCIRSGMYSVISNFAKQVSDEIESEYF